MFAKAPLSHNNSVATMRKTTTSRSSSQPSKTQGTPGGSLGSTTRVGVPGTRGTGGTNQGAPRRRVPPETTRTTRRPVESHSTIPRPLGSDGFIVEKFTVAPSPSRDYYGLRVGKGQLSLYIWKISHGPKLSKMPIQHRASVEDFVNDPGLKNEVKRVFGDATLSEVLAVASGSSNTLATLPSKMLLQVLQYLTPREILRLAQVSLRLHEVCSNNDLWEHLYKKYARRTVGADDRHMATILGWRCLFHRRGLLTEDSMATNKTSSQTNTATPRRISFHQQTNPVSTARKQFVSARSSSASTNRSSTTNLDGKSMKLGVSKSSIPRSS